jgi:hypothetical protein
MKMELDQKNCPLGSAQSELRVGQSGGTMSEELTTKRE